MVAPEAVPCDECEDAADAVWWCRDCACHLCPDCHAHHQRSKRTSTHAATKIAAPRDDGRSASAQDAAASSVARAPTTTSDTGEKVPALQALGPRDGMIIDLEPAPAPGEVQGVQTDSEAAQGHLTTKAYTWTIRIQRARAPWLPVEEGPKPRTNFAKITGIGKKQDARGTVEEPGWLGVDMRNRSDGHIIVTGLHAQGPAAGHVSIMVRRLALDS